MKSKATLRLLLLAAGSSLSAISSAYAGQTWDGTGADSNWSTAANWNLDGLPDFANLITFAGTTRATNVNDLLADTIIGGFNFTNTTAAQAFSISGNRITLGGNITTTASSGAGITDTISLAMILNGNRTITTGNLHNITLSGIISETGGARSLTKSGAGTLTLTTNPTYTGATILNGGRLDVSTLAAPLSSSSGITFTGNSTFFHIGSSSANLPSAQIDAGVTGSYRSADSGSGASVFTIASLSGSGTFSAENSSTGQGKTWAITDLSNFTGSLQLNGQSATVVRISNINDTVANNIIFTGNAGGSGGGAQNTLNYVGSSGLTLTNRAIQIAHSGNSFVALNNNGTSNSSFIINSNLNISGSTGTKTLYLGGTNTGGTSTFAGTLVNGNSTVSLTKRDANTWNLSNASNSYTGGTNITGGTLGFANGALGSSGTINASGGTLRWLPGNTQDISSRLAFTAAATSTFNTNGNNVTFASAIGSSTTGNFVKTGLGTLTLQGANTFTTGTAQLNGGGTLVLDYTTNDNRKLPNGALTLAGGTIVLKGGTTTAETASFTIFNTSNAGTFFVRDGGSAKINLNAFTVGTQSVVSFSNDSMATTDRTNVGGILGAWFTVGNRWAANATNAADGDIVGYTGGTTFTPAVATSEDVNYDLAGGATLTGSRLVNTLRIQSTANDQILDLGANNTLRVSNFNGTNALTGTSGGLLYAGGANGNYTITGPSTARLTPENGNGQALLINVFTGGTLNLDVALSNSGSTLSKAGEGTLVMQRDNTTGFTAEVRVYQGALRLANAGATGSTGGGITVQNGAALELTGGISFVADALNITGVGVSSGGALKNFSGANTYQGAITIGTGGARINSDSGTLTLTGGVVTNGNDVTFGGAGNTTVNTAAISGSGGLVKDGAGNTTLNFTNSYSGLTRIDNGTLTLGHATNTLANTGAVNVNGGILALGSNTDTVGAVTLISGSITGSGAGTLTGTSYDVRSGTISAKLGNSLAALTKTTAGTVILSGENSYTGITTISDGTLEIWSTLASSGIVNNAALIFDNALSQSYINAISGSGTFTKKGAGMLTLSAANTYTGATQVTGGVLNIASTGSTNVNSAVTVSNSGSAIIVNGTLGGSLLTDAGTTVSGSGTITGAAIVSGNLNPGNSPGTMTYENTLTMANTTITTMEIDGLAGPGVFGGHDFINLTGSLAAGVLTYDGALILQFGTTLTENATFNLFDFASQTGSFDSVTLAGLYTGSLVNNGFGVWSLTSGSDNWEFAQSTGALTYTVIPEPGAALLGGLGVLLLLRRRR